MFSGISLPMINFDQIKGKMNNNKMMYSEEGLDMNKQQNAKMKIVDPMLL